MKKFEGQITLQAGDAAGAKGKSPEEAVFDAEVYLNGPVANEVFARYGVGLRVHLKANLTAAAEVG